MNNNSKKRSNPLMKWLKSSIIHKNNEGNKEQQHPLTPKTRRGHSERANFQKFPKLKQANSLDERNLRVLNKDNDNKNHNKNHNKCYSEMNKNQYSLSWIQLNKNKCDSTIMTKEANHQCVGNDSCGPCKRLHFILKHCVNLSLSEFMDILPGYSHIQLSKDFRHLQIFHSKNTKKNKIKERFESFDFNDTKSLLKHIYNTLSKYDMTMNIDDDNHIKQSGNILIAVSKLMMELQTKKDFNEKYMKLGLISKGANGKIYAIKSWKKHEFYAMKEIYFKHLNINILYEILRNWRMVKNLELIGSETEIYVDLNKSTFLIVSHLYKGSMCQLLKETYLNKHRCLTEIELKTILKNGVLKTLSIIHSNGYIHGDIKPENLVYEMDKNNNNNNNNNIITAIIDYDLCIRYKLNDIDNDDDIYSEWRGTLGYSAPEWIPYRRIKSKITPKVDIYSLGLTMLILLCGEQPFLCPTAVKQKLQKENPNINIKQFVYETMVNNGEFMIQHFLNKLIAKNIITHDLYQLLNSMLIFDPKQRFDIKQVINHKWFN